VHEIRQDGNWGPIDLHNGDVYVLLTREGYTPPTTADSLPAVDQRDVFDIIGPVGVALQCDIPRCPAR